MNYKKAYPDYSRRLGRSLPVYRRLIVRDKSDIKQISDLKGKRMAWDYGGHAINQTWQNAVMETGGLKLTDVVQVRVSNLNDGVRAVPEGKVDAAFTAVGIGVVEEANAMEPIRFLSMPQHRCGEQDLDRIRRVGGEVNARQQASKAIPM